MIEDIKRLIESALRSIIVKEDLVDTGALRDNIVVDIFEDTNTFSISIFTMDYYKYLTEKYDLDYQLENHPDYIEAVQLLVDYIADKEVERIMRELN
jgi:hypothetical protein